jgi:hypothetical protein
VVLRYVGSSRLYRAAGLDDRSGGSQFARIFSPSPPVNLKANASTWFIGATLFLIALIHAFAQGLSEGRHLFRFITCFVLGVTIGIFFMETLAPALWDYPIEFQLVLGLAVLFRIGTAFAGHLSQGKG